MFVVLCAGGCPADDCFAVPRVAMQSNTSSVDAKSTNAVDLVLSMNFDFLTDEMSMLLRRGYPC
jgi:hypothetical protein